ncbi:hypothetical protein BH23ACI1_BH23ACI1_12400 [soil metagenome]
MVVVLRSPSRAWRTALHVPHFAMYPVNWLATFDDGRTVAITSRGGQRAADLLRALYVRACDGDPGWPVERTRR